MPPLFIFSPPAKTMGQGKDSFPASLSRIASRLPKTWLVDSTETFATRLRRRSSGHSILHPAFHLGRTFCLTSTLFLTYVMSAQEPATTPQLAPLNPTFVHYPNNGASGRIPKVAFTPQGHPLGFIPSPIDLSHLTGQSGLADRVRTLSSSSSPPSSYDLRTYNEVSQVLK